MVRKCLEPDPSRRYQSAADLRDDLERHRSDRPLKHVRVPSMRERLNKWSRRHPRLSSNLSLVTAALLVIGLLSTGIYVRDQQIKRYEADVAARIINDKARMAAHELYVAVQAGHQTIDSRLPEEGTVGIGIRLCEAALARYGLPDDKAWDQQASFQVLSPAEQQRVRAQLGEACMSLARGYTLWTKAGDDEAARLARALEMNELAGRITGDDAPRAVWEQRAGLFRRLGNRAEAEKASEKAKSGSMRSGRDHYLSGSEALAAGRHRDALKLLTRAVEIDPGLYPAQLALGTCHYLTGKYAEAIACYTTAIALSPDVSWGYQFRGLGELRQMNYTKAHADFTKAAELAPDYIETYLQRAIAEQNLRDYTAAIRDIDRALELGAPKGRAISMRARIRELSGQKSEAKRDLDEVMKVEPADELSWITRGLARLNSDPAGALKDFDAALALNPRSLSALQNKSHVLSKLGRTSDALQTLDQTLELYPDYVKARSGRGIMNARLGNWAAAKADAEETIRLDGSPAYVYYVAGIYAQLSRHDANYKTEAIRSLRASLRAGFGHEYIESDKDLDPIRTTPEFNQVINGVRALNGGR